MSPRPRRFRKIDIPPKIQGYRPIGISSESKDPISLQIEEYEAFKLVDYDGLLHAAGARRMEVSRPTFTRIYESVRKKIACAFVEGRSINIEGGDVNFDKPWDRCNNCFHVFTLAPEDPKQCINCNSESIDHINTMVENWRAGRRHRRRERMGSDYCICPVCGTKISHEPGKPCNRHICPNCKNNMIHN